jgi:hypothetical protein
MLKLVEKENRRLRRDDRSAAVHFRGGNALMDKRGRTRMLLVLLLGGERLETTGIALLDCLLPDLTERYQQ